MCACACACACACVCACAYVRVRAQVCVCVYVCVVCPFFLWRRVAVDAASICHSLMRSVRFRDSVVCLRTGPSVLATVVTEGLRVRLVCDTEPQCT